MLLAKRAVVRSTLRHTKTAQSTLGCCLHAVHKLPQYCVPNSWGMAVHGKQSRKMQVPTVLTAWQGFLCSQTRSAQAPSTGTPCAASGSCTVTIA